MNVLTKTCSLILALTVFAVAQQPAPLMIEKQGSFFVGGHDVRSETLSTLPAYAPSGTVTVDQMYVRYQIPVKASRHSVVMIHGCCLTGKTWETTPDGRMGWDEYFVRKGYAMYVIDQASRGRSAGTRRPSTVSKLARRRQISCLWSSKRRTKQHGRFSVSERNIRRSFRECNFRWRRKPNSGNRWSRTGAHRSPLPIPQYRRSRSWLSVSAIRF
jgi:hypothetical protein